MGSVAFDACIASARDASPVAGASHEVQSHEPLHHLRDVPQRRWLCTRRELIDWGFERFWNCRAMMQSKCRKDHHKYFPLKGSKMKTVLITGANRGIGLEHARVFAARGIHVYATTRSIDDADELKVLAAAHAGNVTVLSYDAANPKAPALLKSAVGDTPIDLVLANAGAMGGNKQSFGTVDIDEVLQLVRINSLAPLKLVEALADNVANSGRKLIAFQSSQMGSIGDNSSGGYYAYRISKAALNMIAKGIARDLGSRGAIAVALHPGWVKTRMGGASAPVSVEQSVQGQQRLFDKLTMEGSGRFFNYDGTELPW